jgi:PAS domain S-box-containing protein
MNKDPRINVSLYEISDTFVNSPFPNELNMDDLYKFLLFSTEMAADEVFWMRSDSEIFYVNEAACKKLGYSRDELIGMHVWEWDPLFPRDVWPQFWRELQQKRNIEFETQHQNKAGEVFPVKIRGHLLAHGEEEVLFAFVTDISDTKAHEAQLAKVNDQISAEVEEKTEQLLNESKRAARYADQLEISNHRYNLAIEGTGVGLWSWDMIKNYHYWSPELYALLGLNESEIIPSFKELKSRVHPDDKDKVISEITSFANNGRKYKAEFRLRCRNDEFRWFRVKGKSELNSNAEPIYMVSSLEDIDDQIQLEQAYKFEQHKFEQFVNLAPIGIAINRFDDGTFEYINDEFSRFTGHTVDALNSMDYWQLTPEKYQPQELEQLEQLEKTGRYGPYQKEYIHKDGHLYPVLLSGIMMHDVDGKKYIWSVVQDMTEHKQTQQALLSAKQKAETANIAKSQFLAAVSHEIRTPMNGVLGALQLLDGQVSASGEGLLDNALNSSMSLLRIINDILDFSKIEANMLSLENIDFSIGEIIDSVTKELGTKLKSNKVSIEKNVSPDFYDEWRGDPTRVKQILSNLTTNAVKFTERGVISINLMLKEQDHKQCLFISVKDTGIGMDEKALKTLFERFTQADSSTTRKYGGTGLGMAITKSLIELMKGTVSVSSEVGAGTEFNVLLPLEKGKLKHKKDQSKLVSVPNFSHKRILIAEDNKINQLIVSAMISKTHAEIVMAENGLQAIELYKNKQPDLILMDIQMPEMDGLEACKKIREVDENIPIIALTANVLLEDVKEYLQSGFDEHIGKPIIQDKLFQQLEKYLEKK